MKVYCYHTEDIQYILERMKVGESPAHLLYGATQFENFGIDVIWHRSRVDLSRWKMMLRTTWLILTNREHIDAVYATHYRGIEPLILLRALGLYRHPIIIWHHQPVITPHALWREWLGKLFYRGIDRMIFFSQKLVDTSLKSPKVKPEQVVLGHWGADLDFYDRIQASMAKTRQGFISTGKELRDMPTLINAFKATGALLDIYVAKQTGEVNYVDIFDRLKISSNIHLHYVSGLIPYELGQIVCGSACVVICCQESKYTVGLTTVVEALALGLPVICSRNPQLPIDFEKEGCGLMVDYYDEKGWERAVRYIQNHPEEAAEMGRRGRKLAETTFNDRRNGGEVAQVIRTCVNECV